MIRHLFSDMDGTILREDGRISPETAQVIRQVGLPLTLVSARSPMEMRRPSTSWGYMMSMWASMAVISSRPVPRATRLFMRSEWTMN